MNRTILLGVAAPALLVVGSVSGILVGRVIAGDEDSPAGRSPVEHGSVSWALGFQDVPRMAQRADAVVIGHTTKRSQFAQNGLTFTDFQVAVTEVMKGAPTTPITVVQTGGVADDGTTIDIDDDPLLESGVDYLFFLAYDAATGRYFVEGGPDGRFVVSSGGAIRPLSEVYPDRKIFDTGVSDLTISDVRNEVASVKAAAATP